MHFKYIIMKLIYKQVQLILSLSLFLMVCVPVDKASAQPQYDNVSGSYNDFYQDLANYGQWIEDPQYGFVWSPNVDGSFRPYYTNGYWAMTEYGNTWVSDYPWGWACFHYGRWTYDDYYGWLWIPGPYWGPAWVSWRYGEGFYGWAPLGPNYASGVDYVCPNSWWVFIPPQYIYSGNYYRYWYGPRDNRHIIVNTNYVNNTYVNNNITYVTGPRQKEVENASHQPVQVYHLKSSRALNTRVHNNEVRMYHSFEIKPATPTDGQRATPPNLVNAPQPIRTPQPVKTAEQTTPVFRNNLPKNNGRQDPPGANINETAKPEQTQPRYNTNPYEYDVNRPVPQPGREPAPQPAPAPRPQQNQPQPRPQQQAPPPPQQPRPQPQPPQQQNARPAPAAVPAPAPAPARENNGTKSRGR